MKRIIGTGLLLWLHSFLALAQREADNWYFGNKASLEFPNGSNPVSFQNSAMNTFEGCATISDKNGQLLFYTNGETVWNKFHQVVKNGTGLMGHQSSVQSSLIVPKPGSSTIYYIFTTDAYENNYANGFRCSTVDVLKDSVLAKGKNTLLYGDASHIISERLTGVHHFNNKDIWVIAHANIVTPPFSNNNPVISQEYIAFKITGNGISVTPNISALPVPANTFHGSPASLKASPAGKYLSGGSWNKSYLFNFNNKTGSVSNPVLLMENFGNYGVEFSPDDSKLYWSAFNEITQFNLLAGSPAAITASKTKIGGLKAGQYDFRGLQLAPDGKIYISRSSTDSLYVINAPNRLGNLCLLRPGLKLASATRTLHGLPNFIQSYFAPPRFTFTGSCAGSSISFTFPNQPGIDSVKWNFGDPSSGPLNGSKNLQPTHAYAFSGTYEVTLQLFTQNDTVFITRPVRIVSAPPIDIGPDQELCEGTSTSIRNPWPIGFYNETYKWSTGSTNGIIVVSKPGIYWLDLTVGDCVVRDSVLVTYKPRPRVTLTDQAVCGNTPVILNARYTLHPGATYLWTPGNDTTATLQVTKSGTYTVVVNLNGCTATDSAKVTITPELEFTLGADIEVCEGEDIYLRAPLTNPPASYLWSDGSTNRYIIKADSTGKYWVRLTRGKCVATDTINVTFKPCPPPPVPYIPNIITPNADGQNDKFEITGIPENAWNVQIYNRWGQILFQQKGYRNNWPEKAIPDGMYYYHLEDPDTGRTWKGWFQVVH